MKPPHSANQVTRERPSAVTRRYSATGDALLALSTALARTDSTAEMAQALAQAVPHVIDCDRALVVMTDRQTGLGHITGTSGYPAGLDTQLRTMLLDVTTPATATPGVRRRPAGQPSRFLDQALALSGSVAATMVPISIDGDPTGWLCAAVVDGPQRLPGAPTARRLRGLADHAATSISRSRLVDRIRDQSLHDGLTGLPNRALVLDRVEQMLGRARRQGLRASAYAIDIDGFKGVNDTLGHAAGDHLLQSVAARLAATLRQADTLGRLGSNEFVVLAEGVHPDVTPDVVAERLLAVLREPFPAPGPSGQPLVVTSSIGIAVGDRNRPSDLLRHAGIALHAAKAAGKNRWALFESDMHTAVHDRHELERDLRGALAQAQFFLVYQPIVDLTSTDVTGMEALLRWRHPVRGVVQPNGFIPLLEETGMITSVGRWVLHEACRQAKAWHAAGRRLDISVNVSARQLETDDLLVDVKEALQKSGLAATSLVLEVTETAMMCDPTATAGRLRSIKALGVRVAIDDFGTGYSSLAYLSQFPVDILKIDQSFVAAAAASPEADALIGTIVTLGHTRKLLTVAEGIEDEGQWRQLLVHHCDGGQGYFFSRPLNADAVEGFLAGRVPQPKPTGPSEAVGSQPAHPAHKLDAAAVDAVLHALLTQHPEAPVAAINRSSFCQDMPPSVPLTRHKIIEAHNITIDVLDPADQVAGSNAFHEATLYGTSRVSVHLARAPERKVTLHYLDARERHGVFLAVFTGDTGDDQLHSVVDAAPVTPRFCRTRKDERSVMLDIDDATTQILGWSSAELVGRRSLEFIHPDDQQRAINAWMEMAETPGTESQAKLRHQCRDGSWRWVELTNRNLLDDPVDPCVMCEMADITDEMAALEAVRAREQLLNRLAEALPLGLFQIDGDRHVVYTNDRLHQIIGTEPASTLDDQLANVIVEDRAALHDVVDAVLHNGRVSDIEVRLRLPGHHELRLCTMSLRALTSDTGAVTGAIVCVADITESARMLGELESRAREMERQATFDLLTRCHNRRSIMSTLELALGRHGETSPGTAVIFVDLDHFKPVNDQLGHAAGDELLTLVADRLRNTVRADDVVGRIGGDEFLIVCPGVAAPAETMRLGDRLAQALRRDITIAATSIELRASIGVAWTETVELDADALVSQADAAMYDSKRQGAGLPVMFTPPTSHSRGMASIPGEANGTR